MKMEEEGTIGLSTTFQELIPEYADSDLKAVTVLKALSHYGRLPSWIAFYLDTLNKKPQPSSIFYRNWFSVVEGGGNHRAEEQQQVHPVEDREPLPGQDKMSSTGHIIL